MTTKRQRLDALIDAFLSEHRKAPGGGWAEVTPDDIRGLNEVIERLIDLKAERDADNDQTIEWDLVDRNTHRRSAYRPIPYGPPMSDHYRRDMTKEQIMALARAALDVAHFNLTIAQEQFNQQWTLWDLEGRES